MKSPFTYSIWGFATAVGLIILSFVLIVATLLPIPNGSTIRPMGLAVALLGLWVLCLFIGAPLSLYGSFLSTRKRHIVGALVGILGLVLSLSCGVIDQFVTDKIITSKSLVLAD